MGKRDKLDDVDPSFAVLVFGDERLRPVELVRERLLREAHSLAGPAKELEKLLLLG